MDAWCTRIWPDMFAPRNDATDIKISMRFKASLARADRLKIICAALTNLRPTCCMKICANGLEFMSVAETGTKLWSTLLSKELLFDSYEMKGSSGKSSESSEEEAKRPIYVEFTVEHLLRSLQRVGNSILDEVTVRLRKRDRLAYLALQFNIHSIKSNQSSQATVHQEIPLKLVRGAQANTIAPFDIDDLAVDVYIKLPDPPTSILRISERYKRMGSRLTLKGSKHGTLSLAIEGDSVNVESTWKQVEVMQADRDTQTQQSQSQAPTDEDDTMVYSITLDAKEWLDAIQTAQTASKVVIGICHESMLVIQCQLFAGEEFYLMYYMSHREA